MVALLGAALALAPVEAQRPQPATIQVDPTKEGWVNTGITLGADETAILTATGSAGWEPGQDWGPAGAGGTYCKLFIENAPVGALLARTGEGAAISVTARTPLTGPGPVMVLYNDCPGQYFDNVGGFSVAVQLPLPPPTAQPVATTAPPVAVATAAPEPAPVAAPAPRASDGGGFPLLPVVGLLVLLAGGVLGWLKRDQVLGLFAGNPRFDESARLESSAWLAPARLRLLQGERRPKRSLTVGGPDADIDFGVQGIWAQLTPTEDGGVRLEQGKDAGRLLVDDLAVVISKRLTNGSRVFMGTREFVFRQERTRPSAGRSVRSRNDLLSRPDPRAAAMSGESSPGRDVA